MPLAWLLMAALAPATANEAPEPAAIPATEPRARQAIVFMVDEENEEAAALLEAIRVELNDLPVSVEGEPPPPPGTLHRRIADASAKARAHGAIGVFWLEGDEGGKRVLQLADPSGTRMLVRAVDEPNAEAAAEAVAVIVRALTVMLLEGRSIGMSAVEPASVTTPAPASPATVTDRPPPTPAPPRPRGTLRLLAGYLGTNYARETSWQNGVELDLGWRARVGVYAGVGYTLLRDIRGLAPIHSPDGSRTVVIEQVGRHPIHAFVGYQQRWPRVALDGELRLIVDPVTVAERSDVLEPRHVDTDLGLGARARVAFRPIPQLALFVGGGLDVALLASEYAVVFRDIATGEQVGEAQTYLTPTPVRPIAVAGLAVSL